MDRTRDERGRTGDGWIDVTVPLESGMVVWPGDPEVRVAPWYAMARGDPCNLSALSFGSHAGTHVDAPIHYLESGRSVDGLPLDAAIGKARVVAVHDRRVITLAELEPLRVRAGERLLFRTANSDRARGRRVFDKSYVHLSPEAARFLASRRVRTVGVDGPSVGPYDDGGGVDVHRALLGAGVLIIEGLDLSGIRPGPHRLVCLPLKVAGGDGSPARVVLKPLARAQ